VLVGVAALALGLGFVNLVDNPTRQVFVVEMVGEDQLTNAVTLNSVMINVARAIGPALAGAFIATIGLAQCFFFNAGTYIGPLIVLAIYTPQYAATAEERAQRTSAPRAAARVAFRSGPIRSCMLIAALISLRHIASEYGS